jgi:hypothetical protein
MRPGPPVLRREGLLRSTRVVAVLAGLAPAALGTACGSRSGLFLFAEPTPSSGDSGPVPIDAADVAPPPDHAIHDDESAPIDVNVPPDSGLKCADGATDTHAYLVSETGTFYEYDPASLQARPLGSLACPDPNGSQPFTMTVTEGNAYVIYQDSLLYKVDLATLACSATAFNPGAVGLQGNFGIASAYEGATEWLYLYGCVNSGPTCVPTLARADLTTYAVELVGAVAPLPPTMIFPVDMKADGYGRLFAIDYPGNLIQIDRTTGTVVGYDATGFTLSPSAEALLAWNGLLYIFGGRTGTVAQYDLVAHKLIPLGQVNDAIVGAGAAPCVH